MENNSGPAIVAPEATPSTPDATPAIAGGLVISPPAPEGATPAPDATGSQTEPLAAGTPAENPGAATPDTAPAAPAGFAAKYGKTLESVLPPVPGNEPAAPAAQSVQERRGISAADLLQMADAAASPAPIDGATSSEATATDAPLQVDSPSGLPQTEPPAPDAALAPSDQSAADQAPDNSDSGQAPTTEPQADNPFSTPTTDPQGPADTGADAQPVTADLGAPALDTTPSDTAPAGTIAGDSVAGTASLDTGATGESTQIPSAAPAESSTNDPKFDALVQKIVEKQKKPPAEATISGTSPDAADTTPADSSETDLPSGDDPLIQELQDLTEQSGEVYNTAAEQARKQFQQATDELKTAVDQAEKVKTGALPQSELPRIIARMGDAEEKAINFAGYWQALEIKKWMTLNAGAESIPADHPSVRYIINFVKENNRREGKPNPDKIDKITRKNVSDYLAAYQDSSETRSSNEMTTAASIDGRDAFDARGSQAA